MTIKHSLFLITLLLFSIKIFSQPSPNHKAGFYSEELQLRFDSADNYTIYYTLDGENPKKKGVEFDQSILLNDRSTDANAYSNIPTNFITTGSRAWQDPGYLVNKANVLRWFYIDETGDSSEIFTNTYFVNEDAKTYEFPVISITTDKENFFDDEIGIYVPGNAYSGLDSTGNYYRRGREWERPIHMELFEKDGSLSLAQHAGARIHGGFSRRFPMKSLRLYARSDYGPSRFFYEFFPDQPEYQDYNRIILRNSGNDFVHTQFRDMLMQNLIGHMNFDTQAGRSFVVYINGEYWGIKNARERYDKHYLNRKYGVQEENLDLLTRADGQVKEGSNTHFLEMLNFLEENDMVEQENYLEIKKRMDVDNYIDYLIAQVYNGNDDWPHNNIDYWRNRTEEYQPEQGQLDGRWRWLLYDIDRTLGYSSSTQINMMDWMFNDIPSTLIFRKLMDNDEFRNEFLIRSYIHLQTTYDPDRIKNAIDTTISYFSNDIDEHIKRWRIPSWRYPAEISNMHTFAATRANQVRNDINNHFGIEETFNVRVDNIPTEGLVHLNGIALSKDLPTFNGEFPFEINLPAQQSIKLTAQPAWGHRFLGWEDENGNLLEQDTIVADLVEAMSYTARFTQDFENLPNPPYQLDSADFHFSYWSENAESASFPDHMTFYYMNASDPGLAARITGATSGEYNLSSRTRINGRNEGGISFINTGNESGNPGYPGTRLGAAGLVLDLSNLDTAYVSWEGSTLDPNSRIYHMRLRYRVSPDSALVDILDKDGLPVEYQRSEIIHDRKIFENIQLPQEIIGLPYVELIWQYYFTGDRLDDDSGARTMLRLGEVKVSKDKHYIQPIFVPHPLVLSPFHFSEWSENSEYSTYPESMYFVYMDEEDPTIDANIAGKTYGRFDLSNRTRINGLGEDGFSFINTGNSDGNLGYPGTRLGGAVLELNTEGAAEITVNWTANLIEENNRVYRLRLRYINEENELMDLVDENGHPIDFNPLEQEEQSFTSALPEELLDKDKVSLFWQYYFTGDRLESDGGARFMLAISEINIDITRKIAPLGLAPIGNIPLAEYEGFSWIFGPKVGEEEPYLFRLSIDEDFENVIRQDTVFENSLMIEGLEPNTPYFWKVRKIEGDWSAIYSFLLESALSLDYQDNSIKVYPNPFNRELNLSLDNWSSSKVQISIMTLSGQLVWQEEKEIYSEDLTLNGLDFSTGVYILKVQSDSKTSTYKIIKN